MTVSQRRVQLEEMLRSSPDDPFLHYALALEVRAEEGTAAALPRMQQVAERFPDYHAAFLQLGQWLAELERFDEARVVYETGIAAARRAGDDHAVGEMIGFCDLLPE